MSVRQPPAYDVPMSRAEWSLESCAATAVPVRIDVGVCVCVGPIVPGYDKDLGPEASGVRG